MKKNSLSFPKLLTETKKEKKKIDSCKYTLLVRDFFFLLKETAFRISKMFMTIREEKYLLHEPIKMLLSQLLIWFHGRAELFSFNEIIAGPEHLQWKFSLGTIIFTHGERPWGPERTNVPQPEARKASLLPGCVMSSHPITLEIS